MAELKIKLTEKTEAEFREAAMKKYGFRKGSLSIAGENALIEWSRMNSIPGNKYGVKDPVLAIKGMLNNVKLGSVDLQHLSKKIRSSKHVSH